MIQSRPVNNPEMQLQLQSFLKENRLPFSDVQIDDNHYLLFYQKEELIGSIGLEWYQSHTLLRSVAIAEKWRGKGLGKIMVAEILKDAKRAQMDGVFLLTETAAPFFLQLGFTDFDRKQAPPAIQSSGEFSQVCPASARLMYTPV